MFDRCRASRLVALERDVRRALCDHDFTRFSRIHDSVTGKDARLLCELNQDLRSLALFDDLPVFCERLQEFLQEQFERAVRSRDVDAVRTLIECGADVCHKDDWATSFAIVHGHINLLTLLISAGGRIELPESRPRPRACAHMPSLLRRERAKSRSSYARDIEQVDSREYVPMPQCYKMKAQICRTNGQWTGKTVELSLPDIVWAAAFGGVLVVEHLASHGAHLPRRRPKIMNDWRRFNPTDGSLESVCVVADFFTYTNGIEDLEAYEIVFHDEPYSDVVHRAFERGWANYMERRKLVRKRLSSKSFQVEVPVELVDLLMDFI